MLTQIKIDGVRAAGAAAKRAGFQRDCAPQDDAIRAVWLEGYDAEPDPEPLNKVFPAGGPLTGQGGDA